MGDETRTGRCLCGAVSVRARLVNGEIMLCHCRQCQQWTGGGPLMSVDVSGLEIKGTDHIAHHHASEWGDRAFCRECGSTLYWAMRGKPTRSIAVGLLDDQSGLRVTDEIFVDHRPGWLPRWPDAAQSTQAQEFEKLTKVLSGDEP